MTDLGQRMLEELQRRNFSETTIKTYLPRRLCESLKISLAISASVATGSTSTTYGSTKSICSRSGSSQSGRFGCTLQPCDSSTSKTLHRRYLDGARG